MKTTVGQKPTIEIGKIRGKLEQLRYPCAVETKWDGEFEYIIITDGGTVLINKYGRTRTDMTATNEIDRLELPIGTVLAGELFMHEGKDFYRDFINDKLNPEMRLAIFDVVRVAETDYRNRPYFQRRAILTQLQIPNRLEHNILAECEIAESWREARLLADQTIAKGYEGVVVKSVNGLLASKNNVSQAKVKKALTLDLLVGDGVIGRSAIAMYAKGGLFVGNVSTLGHSDVRTGQIIEVEYAGLTPTTKLRNPRIKRIRTDKDLPDVVSILE